MAVKELWERLGAKVIFMPAAKHDKIISTLSHLTHLISFSITYNIADDYLRFSPPSLKDLTRISTSPAFVWADIFLSIKANILRDINKFIQVLKKFEKLISGDKKKSLIELIEKVNKKQSALVSQHK
jgi:3-phosphoshikimate 1-carboxyvinyltransferase